MYQILSPEDAQAVLEHANRLEWSEGKARTAALTGTVKRNQEILNDAILTRIGKRILAHPQLQLDHIPLKLHPPKFSKYGEGQRYHKHTDSPWMGQTRTDLSCTLWLSDPDSYEGGELCVNGLELKGKPGECVVYNCGAPHEVKPVTKGERVCVITWIQSRVRDAHKRRIVSDLRRLLSQMEGEKPEWFLEGGAVHSALLRMWME